VFTFSVPSGMHELRPQRLQEDLLFHFKKGMVFQF
jgi:hypothetical protein